MRHIKSERLKKLETELNDLEQWLKLGLVPKKDIEKHKEEIQAIQAKIEEEKERLHFLKESGEVEEFVAPKRQPSRTAYTDMPSIPDIDIESGVGMSDVTYEMEAESQESESSIIEETDEEEATETEEQEEESFFSDRNRWRRGGIIDPDADEW